SALALAAVRFHTCTSSPRRRRARTKPEPSKPIPKNAITADLLVDADGPRVARGSREGVGVAREVAGCCPSPSPDRSRAGSVRSGRAGGGGAAGAGAEQTAGVVVIPWRWGRRLIPRPLRARHRHHRRRGAEAGIASLAARRDGAKMTRTSRGHTDEEGAE